MISSTVSRFVTPSRCWMYSAPRAIRNGLAGAPVFALNRGAYWFSGAPKGSRRPARPSDYLGRACLQKGHGTLQSIAARHSERCTFSTKRFLLSRKWLIALDLKTRVTLESTALQWMLVPQQALVPNANGMMPTWTSSS